MPAPSAGQELSFQAVLESWAGGMDCCAVLDRASMPVPVDVRQALLAAGALQAFQALPPGQRAFSIRGIEDAVKPATRQGRISKLVAALR